MINGQSNFNSAAMTPAGLQPARSLLLRRLAFSALCAFIYIGLVSTLATILAVGGWTWIDRLILLSFAVTAPWSVLGFANSLIGAWLCFRPHLPGETVSSLVPKMTQCDGPKGRIAIVMTIRNEDPARAFLRLRTMKRSLDGADGAVNITYFILSDTSDDEIAGRETEAFASWTAEEPHDHPRIFYRRRADNEGFKAGNLHDFCERWGADFEYFVPLDADSLMTGETVIKMAHAMDAFPKIGILQSLVVGMPTLSAFSRIFQFGMRHGMRAYTLGCTWWSGDCSQFWGHNAVLRVRPFHMHCRLPELPGTPPWGGPILSHDQVEAALMRRAGFEVRVVPTETGSYEDNPPTVLEFIRRDMRWCQGNMQYARLLNMPGLRPTSRFQLLWAMMMFVGVPAGTLFILLIALKPLAPKDHSDFPQGLAVSAYVTFLLISLAPKIIGYLDIALAKTEVERFGGQRLFVISCIAELVFSFLLGAITTLRTGIFMFELAVGRSVCWTAQARDTTSLGLSAACRELWPQTMFGAFVICLLNFSSPALALWSLPLTAGFMLAIPFALVTSRPDFGRFLARARLCSIPEEIVPVPEIAAISPSQRKIS